MDTEMRQLIKRIARCAAAVMAVLLATATPAAAQQGILTGELTHVAVGIGKGQLIRLNDPASTIYLADPEVADVEVMSPQLIYLFGRQPGETNLYAIGPGDVVVADMTVIVGVGVDSINTILAEESPDSTLETTSAGNVVVLQGEAPSGEDIADAANMASAFLPPNGRLINRAEVTGSQQVNLHVRFAEVARSAIRNIGIDWEAVASSGNFFFNMATGPFLEPGRSFGGPVTVTGQNGFVTGYQSSSVGINALIDALASESLSRILAEPNLTAMSGETASFLAGGEFPIPVAGPDNTLLVTFRQYGISLAFTPTVLDDGRISLHVRPEVSEITDAGAVTLSGVSVPGLVIRRAETTVEMGSGQSFMIAGLFRSLVSNAGEFTPFLANLPVLGQMFRRHDFNHDETELIIVVTPYLVQPVSSDRIALPTDRLAAPRDQVPVARLSGPGSGSVLAGSPVGGIVGSAGFILK